MVFYQQSSSLCYILEQRTVYFNSLPATISASIQKCSTKNVHFWTNDIFPSLPKVPQTTNYSHFWLLSCSWEAQKGQEIFSWSFYWILRVSNYEVFRCLVKYYKYFSSVFLTSYFLHFTKKYCSNRAGRLPFKLCIAAFKY